MAATRLAKAAAVAMKVCEQLTCLTGRERFAIDHQGP